MQGNVEYMVLVENSIELRCCKKRLAQLEQSGYAVSVMAKSADLGRSTIHCGLGCLHEGGD